MNSPTENERDEAIRIGIDASNGPVLVTLPSPIVGPSILIRKTDATDHAVVVSWTGELTGLPDQSFDLSRSPRVAVVRPTRPTREEVQDLIAETIVNFEEYTISVNPNDISLRAGPLVVHNRSGEVLDALIARGWLAVSDSQETPTL